jgi:hypothetical protein
MMKQFNKLLLIASFCLFNLGLTRAQTVSGRILNKKDKTPLDYASVSLKKLSADSAIVGAVTTSTNGTFKFNGVAPGKYRLFVGFIGFKSVNRDIELSSAKPNFNFGDLLLEDTGVTLSGVEIKGETPPVVVKKDTLEISASTLKVKENAVVEDLLKKVSGVEVSKDGTVTAQGETIKKVKVDGKDFMGNDPLLATRNLPADMVDKIQIIDEMSEQSKFSGVDDGNRSKILNIVTKNGIKNKGFAGNNTIGYGTDKTYDANISVTRFNEQQRITFLGQFNNVNKQNFGGGMRGGGGMRFSFGGGGGSQPGITTTNAAGIDFGDTYDDGTQFTGSYFFNKTSLFNTNITKSQSFIGNNVVTNNSDLVSTNELINHRFNFMVDTKLDSATSIRIQPNISYSDNTGNSLTNYIRNNIAGNAVGLQNSISKSTSPTVSNELLLRRKFLRRGRTISLSLNTNVNQSDADNTNKNPETLTDNLNNTIVKNIDQLNANDVNSFSNSARLVYTEPMSKTTSLEFNYQNSYAHDNRKRNVFDFNTVTQRYDLVNIDYSNEFENTTWTNALGMSFNKNEKKYNWNIGLAAQYTSRANDNISAGTLFRQEFVNLTPSGQFRYNFSNSKRLNIRYDGRTSQPSIDQIQPVRDNTNTQSVPVGNPNLKPSFSNNFRIFYNNFDFASYRSLFLGAFITQTFNSFANTQRVNNDPNSPDFGKIENGYTNVNGNYNANMFGNLSLPLIKGNKLNLQINGGLSSAKNTNITAGTENITRSLGLNNGYRLVSNLDKLDLNAGISGRWDRSTYTIGQTTNYYTFAPNIDVSYLFPGAIRLQTDITYNKLTGRGAANNTDYTMVNAYISRQFFKNKGTFKFSVNDLLNQNTGISRSATANSIVDQSYNVLKRYYMLSFTYSLTSIAGLQAAPSAPGMMRMGGGHRM